MEDEKFKDLLEDEELKLLRLAALATKQKKQQFSNNTEDSAALPINSIITSSATGSESTSNQIPFVQSERNAFNNNYSWRKQNHSLRRRGGIFPKSNQRSNLIVINPIAPNEGKNSDKNVPALMLPQHKWCNSGNEDSMSPKTLRRTGPTRFNRHGSDSESSESDLENDIDSGSNETVLQDEPPEHFSHLSSDSDTVSENLEKKRRLSFQNLDSDMQCDAFDKSETTSIYNVLKNPSNNMSETFASVQNTSDVRQAWSHSADEDYASYKQNSKEHHQRDTSDNFVQKQINSSIAAVGNGESQVEANRVQASDNVWSHDELESVNSFYSRGASSYSRETAYNADHKNTLFNDKKSEMLTKDDLRLELKKRMKEAESNSSDAENQNRGIDNEGCNENIVWDRNRPKNPCSENADASYSNTYGNGREYSDFSRNRNRQNFGPGKDECHTSLSHRRHQRSLSAERNKQVICSNKDVSNFDYNSGLDRNSDRNRYEQNSSRESCKVSLNRNWYKRSTSRGRHERSSSRSRHRHISSRSRRESSSSRNRHERSSSRSRREHSSSRSRRERSSSRSRRERSSSRSRHERSSSRSRHERSSSRNRRERSRSSHDRSSSRNRLDRSSSRTSHDHSFTRTRHNRSSSRSERDDSSSRSQYNRSSSRSSHERSSSRSRSRHENSSSRDVWKNERSINEGGIKYESFQDLKGQKGKSSPSRVEDEFCFHEEKDKYSFDQGKSNEPSQDKNIVEYNSSQNRIKSEKSSSQNKTELGSTSNLYSRPENKLPSEQSRNKSKHSVKSRLGENKGGSECQDGKHEQKKSFEKRKHHSSSHDENGSVQVLNDKKNRHKQTLKTMNMYNKPNSGQHISVHDTSLTQDKKAVCTSKPDQQCIQLKKFEKTNTLEKSSRKEKSISIERNCSNTDNNKIKIRGQKSGRGSNSTNQSRYSHSRSSSCSSSSSSYSSSSYSSKPKIRSVSSVIKSVPPKNYDIQNKLSSCGIKVVGSSLIIDISDAVRKQNINGDDNKLSVVKSSRMDTDLKACDNSKRVPVHMRLGVLPRKRVIQMPKDVEAAFVNSSSSSEGENVNTKCKRQNIRIVTDVTDSKPVLDCEKLPSEKEKSPKRSPPDLNQEKSKRLKIKR